MIWNFVNRLTQASIVFGLVCAGATLLAPTEAGAQTRIIKLDGRGTTAGRKWITLRLDKACIVELPVDTRDVLVANPDKVDAVVRTARQVYLIAKEVGDTNVFFFDENGARIANLEIRVERDLYMLRSMYKKFMPDANITVDAVNDNIVLGGTVPNAVMADKAREMAARYVGNEEGVVSMIGIEAGEQVLLKVRIVEMQRNVAKQLGVDVAAAIDVGARGSIGILSNNPFSILGESLSDSLYTGGYSSASGDTVTGFLSALERVGMVRTLAEPNLTAITGEAANFLAGGEFPVPVGRDRDGNIQIEYKDFGVSLAFTPVVLSEGRISLKISTEVSELSNDDSFQLQGGIVFDPNGNPIQFGGLTLPSLNVRRAETTVELPSGGSMVMAGLLQDTMKQNLDGIPGVKDMPVLGALAKSRDFKNEQTELVVIVTPYLVGPVNEKKLVTPSEGFAPASDADTILMNKLNARYGKRGQVPETKKLQGPVGFIVN